MPEMTLKRVRELVAAAPVRLSDREARELVGLLREAFVIDSGRAFPCPQCGYPINVSEAGTHIRTGYRSPCIEPPLPGSWNHARLSSGGEG